MKNCDPFVPPPAFAMLTTPAPEWRACAVHSALKALTQSARPLVPRYLEVLVGETRAVDRLPAAAIAVLEIATLRAARVG